MSKNLWLKNMFSSLSQSEREDLLAGSEEEETAGTVPNGAIEAMAAEMDKLRADNAKMQEAIKAYTNALQEKDKDSVRSMVEELITSGTFAPSAKSDLEEFMMELQNSSKEIAGKSMLATFQGFLEEGGPVQSARTAFGKVEAEGLSVAGNLFGGVDTGEMSDEDIKKASAAIA